MSAAQMERETERSLPMPTMMAKSTPTATRSQRA